MNLNQRLAVCAEHYKKWKNLALATRNPKALERAFFWLELHSAFIILHAIEQVGKNDREIVKKLIAAKANLSKRLAEYAKEILSELGGGDG